MRKKKIPYKSIPGGFAPLPRIFLQSRAFAFLSHRANKLFFDLMSQYNGFNNGDLACTWSLMQKRGWKSRSTLYKALQELLCKKFILKTRQGGRNKCCLYALTIYSIDDCKGKLDAGFTQTASPPGGWLDPNQEG